jgi:hypothetical protein
LAWARLRKPMETAMNGATETGELPLGCASSLGKLKHPDRGSALIGLILADDYSRDSRMIQCR